MSDELPFLQDRFEHERSHLYYLPQVLAQRVEQPKPAYLIGSRGTGKTTLLMSLNWHERLNNKWLKDQVGKDSFASNYLGVYLKLPEYKLGAIDLWLASENDDRHGLIIAVYIDLLILEVLIDAVAGMITAGRLQISPDTEAECVRDLLSLTNVSRLTLTNARAVVTLRELRLHLSLQREAIERHASKRTPLDDVLDRVPTSQLGDIGRSVAKRLGMLCDQSANSDGPRWYFKACLDEGETLSVRQQIAINTVVRLSKWPLFPVVAFVREPTEPARTLEPSLTLAQTDRDLIFLDESGDKDFKALAEGVATVRLRAYLKAPSLVFNVRKVLGTVDLNALLATALRQSLNPEGRKLLERSIQNANEPIFGGLKVQGKNAGSAVNRSPPIYQTYLVERLRLTLPKPNTKAWQRRGQDSAELRKKHVAAYLSICRDYRIDVHYASADVILQMSDNRIRDFLSFLHEIHVESKLGAAEFADAEISVAVQHNAILRTSEKKRANVKGSGVAAPTYTGRLVDALGKITRIVQTEGPGDRHLIATERGVFRVEASDGEIGTYGPVLALVRDAAEAGYLYLSKFEGRTWKFRVHTSLAAAFGFSYRGAYYETPIKLRDLHNVCETADPDDRNKLVVELGARLAGDEFAGMPLLFEEKE